MRLFETHFRREVREHRRTLVLLASAGGMLLGFLAAFVPKAASLMLEWPWIAPQAAIVFVVLAVAGDVVGRGLAGPFRFDERLPGGWRVGLAAKVGFLFLACVVAGSLGWLLVNALALYRGEPLRLATGDDPRDLVAHVAPAFVLAGLVLALSTWSPRGSLAFPLGLGALALLGWPLWVGSLGATAYRPTMDELGFLSLTLMAGSLGAAVAGARARRFGRGSGRAALATTGLLTLAAVPASSWTGWRAYITSRPHPHSREFYLTDAVLDPTGESLLCRAHQSFPWQGSPRRYHVGRFDLRTRNWEWLEADGFMFLWKSPYEPEAFIGSRATGMAESLIDGSTWTWLPREWEPTGSAWLRKNYSREGRRTKIVDALTRDELLLEDLIGTESETYPVDLAIRHGGWGYRESADGPWMRYVPSTGQRERLDWPIESSFKIFPDGRVLFFIAQGELVLGDAADGSIVQVAHDMKEGTPWGPVTRELPLELSHNAYLIRGSGYTCYRFTDDPPTIRRLTTEGSFQKVHCAIDDAGNLLIETPEGLEAWNPDTGYREFLFRKEE